MRHAPTMLGMKSVDEARERSDGAGRERDGSTSLQKLTDDGNNNSLVRPLLDAESSSVLVGGK